MKLKIVQVPSIKEPITASPGFAKKLLADYKLDLMALCGFGCSYCSSNTGNYLRINRGAFADLTEAQLGERVLPADDPALTFTWPDVLDKLARQVKAKPPTWGAGKTLVVSQLTDAFSPLPVADGTTEKALRLVLDHTSFRIRVLTKGAVVGSERWVEFFKAYQGRFVVGLSTGTLDDTWAHRIEVGTSSPSARLQATRALQDAGIPTFGMLCPVFPDMLDDTAEHGLEELVDSIRPNQCEHVWAEPFNDRANWQAVRAGYAEGSPGWRFLTDVYERGMRDRWSGYATELYQRLITKARADGWAHKLRYLLYEGDIHPDNALAFKGLEGVLLQSATVKVGEGKAAKPTGWSANESIRSIQRWEGIRLSPRS